MSSSCTSPSNSSSPSSSVIEPVDGSNTHLAYDNDNLMREIISHKELTISQLKREYTKLVDYSAIENERCFAGNNILYHYFIEHLCDVADEKGLTIRQCATDPELRAFWINQTNKANRSGSYPIRFFECIRYARVAVMMFKATTAKHIYTKYNAKHVLDPTMGWGGRLLGALSLGISYTGFDTNLALRKPYQRMINELIINDNPRLWDIMGERDLDHYYNKATHQSITLIWGDCLADMVGLPFAISQAEEGGNPIDLVLTSPPYVNKEVYPGMTRFENDHKYYNEFLYKMIDICRKELKNATICINIAPKMFKDFMGLCPDARKLLSKPVDTIQLLQQKNRNIDKGDLIYVWKSIDATPEPEPVPESAPTSITETQTTKSTVQPVITIRLNKKNKFEGFDCSDSNVRVNVVYV